MATLQELRRERLRKLEDLRKLGINPYPAHSKRDYHLKQIIDDYQKLDGKRVAVVGRIVTIRKIGKIAFLVVKDNSGQLQLFLSGDKLHSSDHKNSELSFGEINLLDSGDFVEAEGTVIKTQTGEISVDVERLRILTKALRPMPTSWDGFTNKEERLRRRYIDINVNKDVYERFIRRSKFWQATRQFLIDHNFIEINIPVLEHTTGGADANPFVTHMDALNQDFYLRISHELPLKRLVAAGYEKVFDIGPRFRNENYSDEHLPEHVAFESYAAYQDYKDGMKLYEEMMKYVAKATWGKLKFDDVNGFKVDLDQPWPVVSYPEIMEKRFGIDVFNPDFPKLKKILEENKVKLEGEVNVYRAMDSVWKIVRKESAGPFWLVHEPLTISPLSKQDPSDPRVSQRFHPIIGGTEMGNGYSELNDPIDQLNRFMEQQALRDAGDPEAQMLDIDFVEMLEYGMPPTCGWSYSERFFWSLEGVSAREGVPFPQLRNEVDGVTKTTYPEIFASNKQSKKEGRVQPQDFTKKIITVVNKELEPWQVANAVAHMDAIIGNEIPKNKLTSGDYFLGKDEVSIPRNTQYPIIIMKGDEKELHKLYEKIKEENLTYHVFIKEMQDTTNDKEIESKLRKQSIEDTVFYGVSFIAPNEKADELTKGFQLWK